jgi:hypothetical protein
MTATRFRSPASTRTSTDRRKKHAAQLFQRPRPPSIELGPHAVSRSRRDRRSTRDAWPGVCLHRVARSAARGFFAETRQVLPQRGHGPRPLSRRRLTRGPSWRSWPLPAVPRNGCYAGESPWVSVIHALWGPEWSRLPLQRHEVLPQRGHGPRPPILYFSRRAQVLPQRGMAASKGEWPRTCDPEPVASVEATRGVFRDPARVLHKPASPPGRVQ